VEGDLKDSLDGQEEILTYTATMSDDIEEEVASFSGITADAKLKIETTAKRAFIDNVEVISETTEETECSGTPEGGEVSITPPSGVPGSSYTVSATGYTEGEGISYQWQSNTNSAGWSDEGPAVEDYADMEGTAGAEGDVVEWRLVVTCTASGESAESTTAIYTVEEE